MRLREFLRPDHVFVIEAPADKTALLRLLAERAVADIQGLTADAVYEGLMAREGQATTGVGLGIAIPHCVAPGLADNQLLVCRIRGGLEYDAIDGEPVHLAFMVLAPENQPGRYLQLLARITRLVNQTAFRDRLLAQQTADQIYSMLREQDARYPGLILQDTGADAPPAP